MLSAPFSLVEVRTQGTAGVGLGVGSGALDSQLGLKVECYTTVGSVMTKQTYMLVEASLSADNYDARGKLFKWQDRAAFQVRPANAAADKIAGVGPYRDPLNWSAGTSGAVGISSLDSTDYFWICVEAERVEVMHGDEATNTLEGTTRFFLVADDDVLLGRIAGTATFVSGSTVGRYISGTAGVAAIMVVKLEADAAV